jgi:predicted dehydrogenase
LKVGILGAGGIANNMAKTLNMMKTAEAYAVAARDQERANTFAEEYGIKKAYGSYEEMLIDPEVDLVYVATPHSHHYEQMKLILDHGKHILCEKAFTVNRTGQRLRLYELEKIDAVWKIIN